MKVVIFMLITGGFSPFYSRNQYKMQVTSNQYKMVVNYISDDSHPTYLTFCENTRKLYFGKSPCLLLNYVACISVKVVVNDMLI